MRVGEGLKTIDAMKMFKVSSIKLGVLPKVDNNVKTIQIHVIT